MCTWVLPCHILLVAQSKTIGDEEEIEKGNSSLKVHMGKTFHPFIPFVFQNYLQICCPINNKSGWT
jgi:hypothetical protein